MNNKEDITGIEFKVLDLSNCDPDQDIILAYVDIGTLPPKAAKAYVEQIKNDLGPKFNERGFDILFIGRKRDGTVGFEAEIADKEDTKDKFDDAIKVVG